MLLSLYQSDSDPEHLYSVTTLRGGGTVGLTGHKAVHACVFVGPAQGAPPSVSIVSLLGEQGNKLREESAPFKLSTTAGNSIFSQQRFIHIYTSPNADRKVVKKILELQR